MSLKAQARKRILLLSLVVVLIGAVGGGYLTWRYISRQHLYALIRARGLECAAKGEDTKAIQFLQVYLRRYPDDFDALLAFAHSRPKALVRVSQAAGETVNALRGILRIDPNRDAERRQLMLAYLEMGYLTEANNQAQALLARLPGDSDAMEVEINALSGLHEYAAALNAAQTRLSAAPTDWTAQRERLQLLQALGRGPDEINKTAAAAIAGHETEQGALLVKAFAARLNNDYSTAHVALAAAAAAPPSTDKPVVYNLIEQLDEMSMHTESMSVLGTLANTGDTVGRKMWLRRLWEDGRFAEVVALAAGPASVDLSDAGSQGMYADALRHTGKDASQVVSQLSARKDDLRALAWAAIEAAEADSSLDAQRTSVAACEAALQGSGNDPYLLYYQAVGEAALGETNLAIDLWGKSAQRSLTWAMPLVRRAQALLSQNRLDEAYGAIAMAIPRAPGREYVALTLANIWYQQVDAGSKETLPKLNDLIDEIQKRDPGEEQTAQMRISLLARSGQPIQATEALRALLAKKPPPAGATLLNLSNISRRWRLGMEQACLDLYVKQYGLSPQAALAEALDDFKDSRRDDGLKLLQSGEARATGRDLIGFKMAVASFLEATGDPGATAAWSALGEEYTNDLPVQRAILASQAAYRDRAAYDLAINRVRALAGDNTTGWKLARARWLMDGSTDPQATTDATTLLADVLSADPTSVSAILLSAEAKRRSGDLNAAADLLAKAQRLDPSSAMMSLDLAQMLQYRGDYDAARQQLNIAANQTTATPAVREQTAVMLAGQGDVAKAISILEPMAAQPDSPESVKLHLAAFYSRLRQFDKAQAICDQLMARPDANSIVLAAQIQMFQRHPEAAEKILERLESLNLPTTQLEQTLGDFYYTFGRLDLALAHYRSATQPAPTDVVPWLSLINSEIAGGQTAAANATVTEALRHVTDTSIFQMLQSRSDLISHIGSSRTERQLLADIIKNPTDDSPAVKVLRVVVPLEASGVSASEILQRLQQLSEDLPHYLPAQTGLTEAQLRLGRCEDAIQSANRAMAAFPNDPWPAELAVNALSLTGHWDEALSAARAWRERTVGDALNADMAIAEIQLHLHDPDSCIATVHSYENVPELTVDQKWQVLVLEARAMVLQGKGDDAAQLLWPIAQTVPAARSTWQTFIIVYLPPASAEQWLNRLSDQLKTETGSDVAQVVLAQTWDVLARRSGNKAYAQLARQTASQLESNPAAGGYAAFATGNFLEEDGDKAGAEAAYRRALARKPDLTDARNNLAELLADRGGDLTEAIDQARQCVNASPQATYYDTLADILGRAKKYDDALAAMRTAVDIEPDNAKWRVHLAKLLLEARKPDEAKLAVAELDLMTPGVRSLPQNYLQELDNLRKQLNAASVSLTH
jgi:predicted Zn-dependent protease